MLSSGQIWSEIRSGLSMYRERLVEAFGSGKYEKENAILDDIARSIVDRIEQRMEKESHYSQSECNHALIDRSGTVWRCCTCKKSIPPLSQ